MLGRLLNPGDEESGSTAYEDTSVRPSLLDRARAAAGLQPTRREEVADALCPHLSFTHRVWGFGICFGAGFIISMGSMLFFHELLMGKPAPFAINYTIGNLLELSSTAFLVGPATQLKRMTSPTRWSVALVYIGAMAATLFSALVLPGLTHWSDSAIALIVVTCIVVQFLAMFWYALSYIPYGRRMFRACCASALTGEG